MDTRQRLGTLMIVTLCLFTTLLVRVTWLQTVDSASFSEQAELNTKSKRLVPAQRGRILDRAGNVLVENQVVSVVMVTKSKLPARSAARAGVFRKLQDVLGVETTELLRRFNAVDDLEGVEVARNVTESAIVYLGEHSDEFPGVSAVLDSQRVYPQGKLAPHVLGYVGDIGDDLQSPPCNARYQTGDKLGKAGVERSYECVLRGMPGVVEYTVDRRNRIVPSETRWIAQPVPGADVRLTIDSDVQKMVEKRVKEGLIAARGHGGEVFVGKTVPATPFPAPAGSAVVFDAMTGAVIAMASYPDYDPSEFVAGISAADYERRYGADAANAPLTNRAISGQYAPGSTAKPFVAISAFNNGLINERTTIEDTGSYTLDNCPKNVRCTFNNAGNSAHGKVDLRRSLTVSSDVFYYRLGQRFWTEKDWPRNGIQDTYIEFGFGGDTGIGLPNEKGGNVPTPESMAAGAGKDNPDVKWRTGDNLNVAIGQGEMLATPLQLAAAYGALANGGMLLYPRIAFDTPAPPVPTGDPETGAEADPATTSTTPTSPAGVPPTESATTKATPTAPGLEPTVGPSETLSSVPASGHNSGVNSAPVSSVIEEVNEEAFGPLGIGGGFGRFAVDPTDSTKPGDTAGQSAQETVVPDTNADTPSDTNLESPTVIDTTLPIPADSLVVLPAGVSLTPRPRRSVDLSADVRSPVLAGLRGVVTDGAGTANPAFRGFPVEAFPVAGKTGTAQVFRKHDTALFVGFGGPGNRFVVSVVLEEAGFGGQAAAPVARSIFEGLDGRDDGAVAYVTSGSVER